MSGPLAGLKIVEMVGIGPGPFCAMMLADQGAEVIRIHSKGSRGTLPIQGTTYDVLARGRKCMAIDLKKPGAREVVLKLIAQADALIEGFRPGVMERLGLGPDICLAANPKLVFGRMTGWGQTGPLAHAAGHDLNYIALSGALQAIGPKDGKPVVPLNLIGDFGGGGLLLAFGMLAALLEARKSGKGQVVDAAMTDGSALLSAMFYGFKASGFWSNSRSSNLLDGAAHFYDTYECADGRFVAIGSIEPQFYALLLEKAQITDPAFQKQMNTRAWPDLKEKLAAIIKGRTREEWCAIMEGTDICFAPVLDWDEAPQHPHNKARETFIEIGGVVQPAPAPRFSRTIADKPSIPAKNDANTSEILHAWGIDAETISILKENGAI